jgi:PIN domain nuclease of toxin-antitoxin system
LGLPAGFFAALKPAGFELLPIEPRHVEAYPGLPMHHRDPFDRILVVQAIKDQLVLLTRDEKILEYDATIMDA